MVLRVTGVDYESLDYAEQEYAVKRLEAALKNFGPGFHVYQYLFKTNRPDIPFAQYDDPIVQTGQIRRRNSSGKKPTSSLKSKSTTQFWSKARARRPDHLALPLLARQLRKVGNHKPRKQEQRKSMREPVQLELLA